MKLSIIVPVYNMAAGGILSGIARASDDRRLRDYCGG